MRNGQQCPVGVSAGPVLFNIFINDLDVGVKSSLAKFVDDTKLWGNVVMLEDRMQIQADLDKLASWADWNQMKFNIKKCKVLHLGTSNPQHTYRLSSTKLTSTMNEKDLEVIIDHNMYMSR